MFESIFNKANIPEDRIILVHVRLSAIHRKTGEDYSDLSKDLLQQLLACRPRVLLIPAFTIYSFMSSRIFHLKNAWSEVGRFSEEVRSQNYPRTPDPMYSLLDILHTLPADLNYLQTFGPNSVFEYLREENAVVVNVDMPGFYSTPIHCVELEHKVPYRYERTYTGKMQLDSEPWRSVDYHAYVRNVDRYGTGSYPPYNHQRRQDYLRAEGIIHETVEDLAHLAWTPLADFCAAISNALAKDPYFLVDQTT